LKLELGEEVEVEVGEDEWLVEKVELLTTIPFIQTDGFNINKMYERDFGWILVRGLVILTDLGIFPLLLSVQK
jgi:hypothetical protein